MNVPKVDLSLRCDQGARPVREDIERVTLGSQVAPQREDEPLYREDIAQRALVEAGENPLLEAVHELIKLVDDREVGVDSLIDDCVHQPARPARGQLRFPAQQVGDVVDRRGIRPMDADDVVAAEEEGDVDRLEVVGVFGLLDERDGADDQQQVAVVFLQLDPGFGVERVLARERMEIEDPFEQLDLLWYAGIDVDPERSLAGGNRVGDLGPGEALTDHATGIVVAAPQVRFSGRSNPLDRLEWSDSLAGLGRSFQGAFKILGRRQARPDDGCWPEQPYRVRSLPRAH